MKNKPARVTYESSRRSTGHSALVFPCFTALGSASSKQRVNRSGHDETHRKDKQNACQKRKDALVLCGMHLGVVWLVVQALPNQPTITHPQQQQQQRQQQQKHKFPFKRFPFCVATFLVKTSCGRLKELHTLGPQSGEESDATVHI